MLHAGELNFSCSQCDYKTAWKAKLQIHERIHSGELPYVCDLCGKGYRRSDNLKIHMVNCANHSGKREFMCDMCNFSANKRYFLKQHIDSVHNGVKPFQCDDCGRSFSRSSALKRHKLLHTGEKPYKCDECGESFRQDANLKEHKGKHKDQPDYICDICSKSFFDPVSFGRHKRFHIKRQNGEHLNKPKKIKIKKFSCEHCGKRFESKGVLEVHMRSHTGEKPFACEVCHKAFSKECNLKVHAMIHSGETPFKCKECGTGFRELIQLKKHMIKTHGLEYKPPSDPHLPAPPLFQNDSAPPPPFIYPTYPFLNSKPPVSIPYSEPSFISPFSFQNSEHPVSTPSFQNLEPSHSLQNSETHVPVAKLSNHLPTDQLKAEPKFPSANNVNDSTSALKPLKQTPVQANPAVLSAIPCAEKSIFSNSDEDAIDLDINIKVEVTETFEDTKEPGELYTDVGYIKMELKLETASDDEDADVKPSTISVLDEDTFGVTESINPSIKKEYPVQIKTIKPKKYSCEECDYKTNYKSNLNGHIRTIHKKELPYTCEHCPRRFSSKNNLRRHTCGAKESFGDTKNITSDAIKCHEESLEDISHIKTECPDPIIKNGIKNELSEPIGSDGETFHNKASNNFPKKYKCNECDYKTKDKSNLNRHIETVHRKNLPFICELCPKRFSSKKNLRVHKRGHHFAETHACDQCDKTFKSKLSFDSHLLYNHRDHMCDECGYITQFKQNLDKHIKTVHMKERPFICELCSKAYSSNKELKIHIERIHEDNDIMCELCGKSYPCKDSLQRHMRTYNHSTNSLVCNHCSEPFTSKPSLHNHLISAHDMLECDECEKLLANTFTLKEHKLLHVEFKPFSCQDCSKTFGSKHRFRFHAKTAHGPKSNICDICSKSFMRSSDLKTHKLKIHQLIPFTCDHCLKKFLSEETLASHLQKSSFCHLQIQKSHQVSQDGKFTCDECGKILGRLQSLKEHKLMHSNPNAFSCDYCSQAYSTKRRLKAHVKRSHEPKSHICNVCSMSFGRSSDLKKHKLVHSSQGPEISNSSQFPYFPIGRAETHGMDIKP